MCGCVKPYIPLILFAFSACGFAYSCRALANDARDGVYVTMGGEMLYSHTWVLSSFLGAAGVAMLPDIAWWWSLVALVALMVPMWPVARIITALYLGTEAPPPPQGGFRKFIRKTEKKGGV